MSADDFQVVAEAFSRTAVKYDAFATDHPHLTRLRHKVYQHFSLYAPAGAKVLELNAGTGTDAIELAKRGFKVHATDISPGMLALLEQKMAQLPSTVSLTFELCSFTHLQELQNRPFEAVFSDLGGLNCIPDLTPVIRDLPGVIQPGGLVTWVLMPPVCLWELASAFTGQFGLAFRRLQKGGTRAHLEGLYFDVYYFSPSQVIGWFGEDYALVSLEGLSVLTPTAESKNLARRHPKIYQGVSWLDDQVSGHWPWRNWGDFYILSMRYQPKRKIF